MFISIITDHITGSENQNIIRKSCFCNAHLTENIMHRPNLDK